MCKKMDELLYASQSCLILSRGRSERKATSMRSSCATRTWRKVHCCLGCFLQLQRKTLQRRRKPCRGTREAMKYCREREPIGRKTAEVGQAPPTQSATHTLSPTVSWNCGSPLPLFSGCTRTQARTHKLAVLLPMASRRCITVVEDLGLRVR